MLLLEICTRVARMVVHLQACIIPIIKWEEIVIPTSWGHARPDALISNQWPHPVRIVHSISGLMPTKTHNLLHHDGIIMRKGFA